MGAWWWSAASISYRGAATTWERGPPFTSRTIAMTPPPASRGPRPLVVITGASGGIGHDLAACYAAGGWDLFLVARSADRLEALAHELEAAHGIACTVHAADLADREACDRLVAAVAPERVRLRALVNNAGLGALGAFHEADPSLVERQLQVNVVALTVLTRAMLPWLLAQDAGHVMNLASVAAFTPGPLMAVYYASKAYVLSLSEALHVECAGTGVTVTAVCPGPTTTGFQRAAGVVSGSGGPPPMTSRAVAEQAWRGALAGRRVVIVGARNRLAALLARHLPHPLMLGVIRRLQERRLGR